MAVFKYKAIDDAGKKTRGRLDASNVADLELRLNKMGLDLINFTEIKQSALSVGRKKLLRQELITFTFHLEQLVRSGVPLLDGLADLRGSVSNADLKVIASALIASIEGGKTFSESLEQFPKIFDTVFVSLIRAGEESGKLAEVLKNITESLKWQDEIAAQTKQAIFYPAFVGLFVFGSIFFVMAYLVPRLSTFITNMGQELPLHTRILISVSDFLTSYWYLLFIVPVVTILLIKYMARRDARVRYKLDDFKIRVWVIGPIFKKIILARFANYFALLYSSGVTVLNSLRINEDITGNMVMSTALREMQKKIADGNSISDSIDSISLFPPLVRRMIKVGETTGELDTALDNVSYFYDREVKGSIEKMQSILGPVLTIFLAVNIGWVMLSVFWPLYDVIVKVAR